MIAGIIMAIVVVSLFIGVMLLVMWVDHPKESWYDKHLKRMWKDTKDDQGGS